MVGEVIVLAMVKICQSFVTLRCISFVLLTFILMRLVSFKKKKKNLKISLVIFIFYFFDQKSPLFYFWIKYSFALKVSTLYIFFSSWFYFISYHMKYI